MAGAVRLGVVRQGRARIGTAGMVRLVRQGKVSFGKARRDMAGVEWRGGVMKGRDRSGMVGHGRHGLVWLGREWPGRERSGMERLGKVGKAGEADGDWYGRLR